MTIRPSAAVVFVAVLALLQGASVSTQSPDIPGRYVITDLGTLGGNESVATAINEFGEVAGWARRSDGAQHAFFFDTTMHDLGTIGGPSSEASGVNRVRTVVGQSLTAISNTKGFIYSGGVRRSLGTLGGSNSAAYAVNDDGDVVGAANTTNNVAHRAFLYRDRTMKSLGTLGGANSAATAINNAGEIAGSSTLRPNSDVTHAFLYRNGVMTDIGTLGTNSEASGLDIDGSVVGDSTLASGDTHAFVWRGGVMTDLGTLGGHNSVARAIREFGGAIVGESEVTGSTGTHAFLYQDGVMTDLNTRLPSGSGWVLESATAINNVGEIAGVGTINGQRHAFLLTLPVRLNLMNTGNDEDSNFPRFGVQVGHGVRFVTTVSLLDDVTAHQVVLTDTISGPVTIDSVQTFRGSPCTVAGRTVTCRIPQLGELSSFASEETLIVTVRVTGTGVFSHTAHATAANAVPSPATDRKRREHRRRAEVVHAVEDNRRRRNSSIGTRGADVGRAARRRRRPPREQQSSNRLCACRFRRGTTGPRQDLQHRPARRLGADIGDGLSQLWTGDHFPDAHGGAAGASDVVADAQHDDRLMSNRDRQGDADRRCASIRRQRRAVVDDDRRSCAIEDHRRARRDHGQHLGQRGRRTHADERSRHRDVRRCREAASAGGEANLPDGGDADALRGHRSSHGARRRDDRMPSPCRRPDSDIAEHEYVCRDADGRINGVRSRLDERVVPRPDTPGLGDDNAVDPRDGQWCDEERAADRQTVAQGSIWFITSVC